MVHIQQHVATLSRALISTKDTSRFSNSNFDTTQTTMKLASLLLGGYLVSSVQVGAGFCLLLTPGAALLL